MYASSRTPHDHCDLPLWRGTHPGTAQAPRLTSCNCSICRRYGTLWAYYNFSEVRVIAARGASTWKFLDSPVAVGGSQIVGRFRHFVAMYVRWP